MPPPLSQPINDEWYMAQEQHVNDSRPVRDGASITIMSITGEGYISNFYVNANPDIQITIKIDGIECSFLSIGTSNFRLLNDCWFATSSSGNAVSYINSNSYISSSAITSSYRLLFYSLKPNETYSIESTVANQLVCIYAPMQFKKSFEVVVTNTGLGYSKTIDYYIQAITKYKE